MIESRSQGLWIALLALSLVAAACDAAPPGGGPQGEEAGAEAAYAGEWIRVAHPDLPLTFEVPEETYVRQVSVFSLAQPRSDDHRRIDVTLFGVRLLADRAATLQAVQFGFFWVTEEFLGVESETLETLRDEIDAGAGAADFLRRTFYAGQDVEIEDLGGEFVDAYPARRLSVSRTVARGTRDERRVRGEAIVVPFSARAALTLIARYDEVSTPSERIHLFPRVFRSVRLGRTPHAPLEVRRSGPAGSVRRAG